MELTGRHPIITAGAEKPTEPKDRRGQEATESLSGKHEPALQQTESWAPYEVWRKMIKR